MPATMSVIPLDDRDGVIWLDGRFVPWREAKIHVLTHALHYGSCVFEGERVYGGEIFKLREHSERLFASARILDFEIPWSLAEIERACTGLVAAMKLVDGYVRPLAWRGAEQIGVSGSRNTIHLAIAAWPLPAYSPSRVRLEGIRMTISRWARPPPNSAPTAAKAAGPYVICTLSKRAAEAAGYDDALMLDWRGWLAEASAANLFLVIGGVLHTPTPDCFLDGITRQTVMALARAQGIEVVERAIMPAELATADEVFLTGTAIELLPVRAIDQHRFTPGPVSRALIDSFGRLVGAGRGVDESADKPSPSASAARLAARSE